MTSRPRTKRFSYLRTCGPVIFIVTIFLLFTLMYWLYFDLREQLLDQRMRIEQGEYTFGIYFCDWLHGR